MARVFGYARVSSREQNLDRQISALKKYVDEQNILTVRGKVILQSQGKEFFTWHGKDFFT